MVWMFGRQHFERQHEERPTRLELLEQVERLKKYNQEITLLAMNREKEINELKAHIEIQNIHSKAHAPKIEAFDTLVNAVAARIEERNERDEY